MALQFIERPDEIPAKSFVDKETFKDQCAAELAYEAEDPHHIKSSSTSGVKSRSLAQHLREDGNLLLSRRGMKLSRPWRNLLESSEREKR